MRKAYLLGGAGVLVLIGLVALFARLSRWGEQPAATTAAVEVSAEAETETAVWEGDLLIGKYSGERFVYDHDTGVLTFDGIPVEVRDEALVNEKLIEGRVVVLKGGIARK